MQFQTFSKAISAAYPIVVLAPKLEMDKMVQEYLDPGMLAPEDVIAYKLYITGKKTSASDMRDYLTELAPTLQEIGAEYILVSDSEYFKVLTGVTKSEPYLGYVLPNKFPLNMQNQFKVLFVPNFRQVFYDPARTRAKIQQSLTALFEHRKGHYREPGCSIISFSAYPETTTDIALWLQKLLDMDCDLTCDIEAFSLKHHSAGIGTISFAWSKNEGIAFAVDLGPSPVIVRNLLIKFFIDFAKTRRSMKYHKITFDVTVLIYQLFMKDLIDTEGLLNGLEIMLGNFDCTRLITYLATNSCAGNELGLKVQAQEFAGNYAVDNITDITKIPLPQLLEYNLIDSLSTWYVHERHWDTLVADQQLEIYETIFKPAVLDVIQMQLTGMPLDMAKVLEAKEIFETDRADCIRLIQAHPLVQEFTYTLDEEHVEKRNSEMVKKRIVLGDEPQEFNPNSSPQKQRLFYEVLGLPVIELTKSKQASTSGETLEKLKAYTDDESVRDLLNAFLEYTAVDKLYSTFIPPMVNAVLASDGMHYLFGDFNLGGTVSGRLSSSDPNLQTIPTKKNKRGRRDYAKLIKMCFVAPPGWIKVGLDFASLEDKISALTTKDPQKLKVYTGIEIYEVVVNGTSHHIRDDATVIYEGQSFTGAKFYERFGASSLL
jgi:DNA polymerase-1